MTVKLSLRREKTHLELLQSYGNADYSDLYRLENNLKDEMQALVLVMARQSANCPDNSLRLNSRVQLRRLADRHKMIHACEHVLGEGYDFDEGHPERMHYLDILDYTQFALDRLTELFDENQRTIDVPRISQRISD